MSLDQGTVGGIDRDNGRVLVDLRGGAQIEAAYLSSLPPPPASLVRVHQTASGTWECSGVIGHQQQVLHDDFSHFYGLGGNNYAFDTLWWCPLGFPPGNLDVLSVFNAGVGEVVMTSGAVAGQSISLTKKDTSYNPQVVVDTTKQLVPGLWFSCRIRYPDASPSVISYVGFSNYEASDYDAANAADSAAVVYSDSLSDNGRLALVTKRGTTANVVFTEIVPTQTDYFYFDIVVVAGQWAALWVSGATRTDTLGGTTTVSGPFVQDDASVPNAAFQPFFTVYPRSNAAQSLFVDWCHVEHFTGAVKPS